MNLQPSTHSDCTLIQLGCTVFILRGMEVKSFKVFCVFTDTVV